MNPDQPASYHWSDPSCHQFSNQAARRILRLANVAGGKKDQKAFDLLDPVHCRLLLRLLRDDDPV